MEPNANPPQRTAATFGQAGAQVHPDITLDRISEAITDATNDGFCIACGAEANGVEPDAAGYTCEGCGAHGVYGTEELLVRGLHH